MKIPKDIILPQPQEIIDLESTIKATKLLATTLDELYRLLYGDVETVFATRRIIYPFRTAEGSGSSTATGWHSRLSIQTRLPDYMGIEEQTIQKAKFYAVIGLKCSSGATVKGKVRFSYQDNSYVEGPERIATTDWQYWSESMPIDKSKLLDVEPPINAVQQYMNVYLDSGTAYYYAGYSFIMVYLE